MSIVQAYRCDHTGKLFGLDQKEKYVAHLRKEAYKRAREKLIIKTENRFKTTFAKMRAECKTLQDICDYIILNPTLFYEYASFTSGDNKLKNWRDFEFTYVKMKLTYDPECSNSHGAPIGEETNWHRTDDKPKSFPGYKGRLSFEYNQKLPFFPSKMFEDNGMHCGSGGGNGRGYGCDLTIWVQDWPGLKSELTGELTEIMLDKLTDNLRNTKMKTHNIEAYAEIEER